MLCPELLRARDIPLWLNIATSQKVADPKSAHQRYKAPAKVTNTQINLARGKKKRENIHPLTIQTYTASTNYDPYNIHAHRTSKLYTTDIKKRIVAWVCPTPKMGHFQTLTQPLKLTPMLPGWHSL